MSTDRVKSILVHDVCGARGAPMGRHGARDKSETRGAPRWFYLRQLPLDAGGYDAGGAYWGHGDTLYGAFSDTATNGDELPAAVMYLRAINRDDAKRLVCEEYPNARFFDGSGA